MDAEATRRKIKRMNSKVNFVDPNDAVNEEEHHTIKRGNDVSMKKIVESMYSKVLKDDQLKPFFQDMDMSKLKLQQSHLMALVLGGGDGLKEEGSNVDLRALHMRLLVEKGLTLSHWDKFTSHLKSTLEEIDSIPAETKTAALEWMQSTRQDFRPAEASEIAAFKAKSS